MNEQYNTRDIWVNDAEVLSLRIKIMNMLLLIYEENHLDHAYWSYK